MDYALELLDKDPWVFSKLSDKSKQSLLCELIKDERTTIFLKIFDANQVEVNSGNDCAGPNVNLLLFAIVNQKWNFVKILVNQGANLQVVSPDGLNVVHFALMMSSLVMAIFFLKRGVRLNTSRASIEVYFKNMPSNEGKMIRELLIAEEAEYVIKNENKVKSETEKSLPIRNESKTIEKVEPSKIMTHTLSQKFDGDEFLTEHFSNISYTITVTGIPRTPTS